MVDDQPGEAEREHGVDDDHERQDGRAVDEPEDDEDGAERDEQQDGVDGTEGAGEIRDEAGRAGDPGLEPGVRETAVGRGGLDEVAQRLDGQPGDAGLVRADVLAREVGVEGDDDEGRLAVLRGHDDGVGDAGVPDGAGLVAGGALQGGVGQGVGVGLHGGEVVAVEAAAVGSFHDDERREGLGVGELGGELGGARGLGALGQERGGLVGLDAAQVALGLTTERADREPHADGCQNDQTTDDTRPPIPQHAEYDDRQEERTQVTDAPRWPGDAAPAPRARIPPTGRRAGSSSRSRAGSSASGTPTSPGGTSTTPASPSSCTCSAGPAPSASSPTSTASPSRP